MAMILNTLYNLTDFWFAGLLSDEALAGVSIAGSVFFLIISIGAGIQNGTTAIIANEVGKKRFDDVSYWLNQAAYAVLFISVASLQAIKQPLFPLYLGIARQLVIPACINYYLIVVQGFPMISIFITIVSVVVISSIVSHWYTWRQLTRLTRIPTVEPIAEQESV